MGRNISLVVEYDGTNYHGWQCQPNGVTLQEVVQGKIEMILDHPIKIYAAGRTDAGVHAFGQVINFFTEKTIELVKLTRGLNSLLPADIRIKQGREVDESFHARYSAKSKSYVYAIFNVPYLPPFNARYVWHIPYKINSVPMNETIQKIVGTHDFSSFKKKDEFYRNHERSPQSRSQEKRGIYLYFHRSNGFSTVHGEKYRWHPCSRRIKQNQRR